MLVSQSDDGQQSYTPAEGTIDFDSEQVRVSLSRLLRHPAPWLPASNFLVFLLKPDFSAEIRIKYGFDLIATLMPSQTLKKCSAQLYSFSSSAPAILKKT